MDTSKGTERVNDEGAVEIKVDSVNYRSPPGHEQEPKKENVEIIHQTHPDEQPGTGRTMVEAASKVAEKVQSAKDTIFGAASTNKRD